jgi:hypothetical protein
MTKRACAAIPNRTTARLAPFDAMSDLSFSPNEATTMTFRRGELKALWRSPDQPQRVSALRAFR